MMDGASSAFNKGLSAFKWGANKVKEKAEEHHVKEKTIAAYESAKQKSDESGFTQKVVDKSKSMGKNFKDGAYIATNATIKGTKNAYKWN